MRGCADRVCRHLESREYIGCIDSTSCYHREGMPLTGVVVRQGLHRCDRGVIGGV